MNAAIYSLYHKKRTQSFPFKQQAIRELAKKYGLKIIREVEENAVGDKRQKLEKRDSLIELAGRKEIDAIIVWSLSELGHSLSDVVITLAKLNEFQIRFISITDNLDSSGNAGKALFQGLSKIVGYFGQGRPASLYKKADKVRHLFYKENLSQSEIARRLKIGRASVQRILKQERKK